MLIFEFAASRQPNSLRVRAQCRSQVSSGSGVMFANWVTFNLFINDMFIECWLLEATDAELENKCSRAMATRTTTAPASAASIARRMGTRETSTRILSRMSIRRVRWPDGHSVNMSLSVNSERTSCFSLTPFVLMRELLVENLPVFSSGRSFALSHSYVSSSSHNCLYYACTNLVL